MARRDAAGVRLLTRTGIDWSSRYPGIASAVNHLRCRSCLLDGEVVILPQVFPVGSSVARPGFLRAPEVEQGTSGASGLAIGLGRAGRAMATIARCARPDK
jgi:hypothetical protein